MAWTRLAAGHYAHGIYEIRRTHKTDSDRTDRAYGSREEWLLFVAGDWHDTFPTCRAAKDAVACLD